MNTPRLFLAVSITLFALSTASAAEILGVVSRIDLEKKEVQLDGRGVARGKTMTLVLDDATKVLFGRQTAAVTDLAVGKLVRVSYETRDDRQLAQVIHVGGPKPKGVVAPAEKGTITGVLRRIALTDRELVVIGTDTMGKNTETTVLVPEMARIIKDGKAAKLDSLRENDPVSIAAEKRDGRLTATTVQVGAAAKSDLVPKIRLALRIADFLLQKMER